MDVPYSPEGPQTGPGGLFSGLKKARWSSIRHPQETEPLRHARHSPGSSRGFRKEDICFLSSRPHGLVVQTDINNN